MKKNRVIGPLSMMLVASIVCLTGFGTVRAQTVDYAFAGKFKLAEPVHWGKNLLEPGNYTIQIASTQRPILARIS